MGKQKLLYIIEHCSTGGMPQYTLKQIETFKDQFDIHVIELKFYGDAYVVQRNKMLKTIPFIALNGNLETLQDHINEIKPDIIHIQENPISIMDEKTCGKLFYPDRDYFILATTHSSYTRGEDFMFIPDRIIAVNKWQKQQFEGLTEVGIWEYPIEDKKVDKWYKDAARYEIYNHVGIAKNLRNYSDNGCKGGLSGTSGYYENWAKWKKHILNVGLFTPSKNQGELFEVARKNPDNLYHFVGNQAVNFEKYWKPLMKNKPDNCIVWGERDDVDLFYQACDEMYFTSKLELNPLCVKEALSYSLPVKMYRLPTYLDDYDNNPLVTYLS